MKPEFSNIELAFEFVSGAPPSGNGFILDRETGKTHWRSDLLRSSPGRDV